MLMETAARERPMLFSGAMVRAILSGTKTQTRRTRGLDGINSEADAFARAYTNLGSEWWFDRKVPKELANGARHVSALVQSPYGAVGDRLWVRETWRTAASLDHLSPKQMGAKCVEAHYPKPWAPVHYLADSGTANSDTLSSFDTARGSGWGKRRVSLHLPRWACRIVLEITDVRVQRLHDINEDDARAEVEHITKTSDTTGGFALPLLPAGKGPMIGLVSPRAREAFEGLWSSINGRDSWDANPWAWALTFRRVTP